MFAYVLIVSPRLNAQEAPSKIIPIIQARTLLANVEGSDTVKNKVTFAGRVITPNGLLHNNGLAAFIQDKTGGIFITSNKHNYKLNVGDSIIVSGIVSSYLDQIELNNPDIKIINCPKRILQPVTVELKKSNVKNYEGMLIHTTARVIDIQYTPGGEVARVTDSKGSDFIFSIYNFKSSPAWNILAKVKIGDIIGVTGVLGRYNYKTAVDGGYEVYPRYKSEVYIISESSIFTTRNILIAAAFIAIFLLWIIALRIQVKRKTNSLNESEEKFRMLAETTSSAIMIYNETGLLYANPVTAAITGYSIEELKKTGLPGFMLTFNSTNVINNEAQKQSEKKQTAMHEIKIQTKDKKEKWIYYSAVPIRFEGKNAFLGTAVDITRIKEIEDELIQAKEKADEMSRIKSSFLASMSHELRTPMNGIMGFANILTCELKDNEHRSMAQSIMRSSRRLMLTLNQILDLARVEANKKEINLISINVAEKILEAVELFKPEASNKNLLLEADIERDNLFALLDESLITQILDNLIHNAVKYTEKGKVVVQVKQIDRQITISIIDTGIGIPDELSSTIFEEFRQASEGWGRKFEGIGLGLTLTKKFVELMNGRICVKSKVGEGSVFTISFPAPDILQEKI